MSTYWRADEHALQAPVEDLQPGGRLDVGRADQHGLGLQDRLAEHLEPGGAQRGAGLDDVGDQVGHAELDGGLDRAVEVDDGLGSMPRSARLARTSTG